MYLNLSYRMAAFWDCLVVSSSPGYVFYEDPQLGSAAHVGNSLQVLIARYFGFLSLSFISSKILSILRENRTLISLLLLFAELGSNMAVPQAKMALVLNSPLWKPVFRHQIHPELGLEASWPTHLHPRILRRYLLFTYLCIWNDKCLLMFYF